MTTSIKALVPKSVTNHYHLLQSRLSSLLYASPQNKLKIIGVTGTDGKTTTVNLIYHILKTAGYSVGMLSTVRAVIGEHEYDTGLHVTTPSPIAVKRYLKQMVASGAEYAVIEVTSHALDQNRVAGLKYCVGVITNITHEHLDYHKTFTNYVAAKARLLDHCQVAVLNRDDPSFDILNKKATKAVSFGIKNRADYNAKDLYLAPFGARFTLTPGGQIVRTPLLGTFNIYNVLCALAAVEQVGVDRETAIKALKSFPPLIGRMQRIELGQNFTAVVDFAHTPMALEAALKALKPMTRRKLITVFGAAGERDKDKRPMMGKVAIRDADIVVLTSEDPRGEDPNIIMAEIAQGVVKNGGVLNNNFWMIKDRGQAITFAIKKLAGTGDLVAVFGKGHEKSMNIKGVETPWSDQEVIKQALKERHQDIIASGDQKKNEVGK